MEEAVTHVFMSTQNDTPTPQWPSGLTLREIERENHIGRPTAPTAQPEQPAAISELLEQHAKDTNEMARLLIDSHRLTKLDGMISEDCGFRILLRWNNHQDVMTIEDGHGNVWGEAYPTEDAEDEDMNGTALRAAIDSIKGHNPLRNAPPEDDQPAATGTPDVEKLLEATTIDLQNALIDRAVLQVDKNRLERELAEARAELQAERNLHGQTRVVVEELNTICNDLRNAGQPQFVRSEAIRLLREDQAALRAELTAMRGLLGDACLLASASDETFQRVDGDAKIKAFRDYLATKRKEDGK